MKYKVGDRVRIKSIDWYNENKNDINCVDLTIDSHNMIDFTATMAAFCGRVMTITDIRCSCYHMLEDSGMYSWIDGMIEGLCVSKYNKGDFVGVYGYETDVRIEEVRWDGASYSYKVYLADEEEWLYDDDIAYKNDKMIKGLVEEKLNKDMKEHQDKGIRSTDAETKEIWHCPEGYIFKDENGNVINATKIVLEKKKKVYPKTYEECCQVLEYIPHTDNIIGYKWNILQSFQKLLICRDAYWKIAGEEMGLDKPWESKRDGERCYVIVNHRGNIITDIQWHISAILAFPTEEMRDAFYENFKSEIESCKELL